MEANKYTTPKTIIQELYVFANGHDQLNHVFTGTDTEVDLDTLEPTQCPFVFFGIGQATFDEGSTSVDIEIVVADVYLPQERDGVEDNTGNFEVVSTQVQTLTLLRDVLKYLKHNRAEEYGTGYLQADMALPVVCEPFTAKYKEHLTGWSATVTVEFDATNDLCIVPR